MTTVRCCLSPDDRHSAYCITTKPQRTRGRSGTGAFGTWSDDTILREMHRQAEVCVEVMALPEQERHRAAPNGGASPAQAASLNAVTCLHLEREAISRGLIR